MTGNLPIKIFVDKIENEITFRIKTGCYLDLFKTETIKLIELKGLWVR